MFSQDEVVAARPDIDERVSQLVAKGRWQVPGYKVRTRTRCSFSDRAKIFYRSALVISQCYKQCDHVEIDYCVYTASQNLFYRKRLPCRSLFGLKRSEEHTHHRLVELTELPTAAGQVRSSI